MSNQRGRSGAQLPSCCGADQRLSAAGGPGVLDSHVYTDYQIPLLRLPNWQVNCLGTGRPTAINRMKRALRECALTGYRLRLAFIKRSWRHRSFCRGLHKFCGASDAFYGVNSGEKSWSAVLADPKATRSKLKIPTQTTGVMSTPPKGGTSFNGTKRFRAKPD